MNIIKRSQLSFAEKQAVFELWNKEYPVLLSYDSMEAFEGYLHALAHQSHILLLDEAGSIKGWYFEFDRADERYFAIILDAGVQGRGFGTKLLDLARQYTNDLNGWVIDHNHYQKKNGEYYQSPLAFYLKNGFKVLADVRLETDNISAVKIHWRE
ncbi:N-acetyltransferase [bacterium]|nr:N-acetyltransferase [bacterium]